MIESHSYSKLPPHFSGKYKGSFAYITIKDRLPVILVKVLDTVCRDKNSILESHGEIGTDDMKNVIGRLSALQNEMITNKPIKPLLSDGPDISFWNTYLEEQNSKHDFPAAWYDSSWLYVECYLYRRIREAFELSSVLKDYDPFYKQKLDALTSTMDDVSKLGKTLQQLTTGLQNSDELHSIFAKYLQISLWGNKCDLSMSALKEDIPKSSGDEESSNILVNDTEKISLWGNKCDLSMSALKENIPKSSGDEESSNILVNDTEKVWNCLKEASQSHEAHIHLILDNAGFELFSDFCLLHFLLAAKLVSKISIHVKQMPWFVSDTLEKDIQCLLQTLSQSNNKVLCDLSKQWLENFSKEVWKIDSEMFWTLPHDYSEMYGVDPDLYKKLSQSDLLIFKGDLNYRKLTGDRQWEETTSFKTALNGFLPTCLVSLRTVKADVIVGLQPGTTERLNSISSNWKYSGEYALIQFAHKEE